MDAQPHAGGARRARRLDEIEPRRRLAEGERRGACGDDIEILDRVSVIELPGHAPGLVGLFRESDRLALVSDCLYTLDPQTGIKGRARVPHPAFNISSEQAA